MGDDDPGDPTQDRYDISQTIDPTIVDNDALNLETPYADPGEFLDDVAARTVYGQRSEEGGGGDWDEDGGDPASDERLVPTGIR
jgi:hypothetical protein